MCNYLFTLQFSVNFKSGCQIIYILISSLLMAFPNHLTIAATPSWGPFITLFIWFRNDCLLLSELNVKPRNCAWLCFVSSGDLRLGHLTFMCKSLLGVAIVTLIVRSGVRGHYVPTPLWPRFFFSLCEMMLCLDRHWVAPVLTSCSANTAQL